MEAIILEIYDGFNGKGGLTGKLALIECQECGNHKLISYSRIINKGGKFCSNKCYHLNLSKRKRELSNQWQGGRVKMSGYWYLRQDDSSYKKEHTIIMENKIGRKLFLNECVHHINGNKLDNRMENLQLMTKSEHHKLHYKYLEINNNGQVIKSNYLEKFL